MKIKILRGTNCDGKRVSKGDVVEASGKDSRILIAFGFAEEYEAPKRGRPKKAPVDRMVDEVETRDAG